MDNKFILSFLGDFAPVNRIETLSLSRGFEVFDSFRESLDNSAYVIANLECPLTNCKDKIKKIGPNLKADPETIELLKYLKINVVSLANNHILDYNIRGLNDTLTLLDNANIQYTGIASHSKEFNKSTILEKEGVKIALLNVCEKEFNFSRNHYPTINVLDLIDVYNKILELKSISNYVFIVYHGGNEYYKLPSPNLQKRLHFFADAGADLIVCHHSHIVSGYERYNGTEIYYSLGNFIFDWSRKPDFWYLGGKLDVEITLKSIKTKLIPFIQNKKSPGITFLNQNEIAKFNSYILDINQTISDPILLRKEWEHYSKNTSFEYYNKIFSINTFHRRLLNHRILPNFFLTKNKKYQLYNILGCESHYETLLEDLTNIVENDRNL
jgi:hypothetical protein